MMSDIVRFPKAKVTPGSSGPVVYIAIMRHSTSGFIVEHWADRGKLVRQTHDTRPFETVRLEAQSLAENIGVRLWIENTDGVLE